MTGGEVAIEGVVPEHLLPVETAFNRMGVGWTSTGAGSRVSVSIDAAVSSAVRRDVGTEATGLAWHIRDAQGAGDAGSACQKSA